MFLYEQYFIRSILQKKKKRKIQNSLLVVHFFILYAASCQTDDFLSNDTWLTCFTNQGPKANYDYTTSKCK